MNLIFCIQSNTVSFLMTFYFTEFSFSSSSKKTPQKKSPKTPVKEESQLETLSSQGNCVTYNAEILVIFLVPFLIETNIKIYAFFGYVLMWLNFNFVFKWVTFA